LKNIIGDNKFNSLFKIKTILNDSVFKIIKGYLVLMIITFIELLIGFMTIGIKKYAILLGNEANGVKQELLKKTDLNVRIEMNNKLESLNVSVAGSIIMYYLNN
jgi:hypothetical protein